IGSVRSMMFTSPTSGWGIDGIGNIIHTTDGGETWKVNRSIAKTPWSVIFFINDREGWALGDSGILHTSNAGQTWQFQHFHAREENYLEQIGFTDEKHGWAVGRSTCLRTVDGGKHWKPISSDWKHRIPDAETLLKQN